MAARISDVDRGYARRLEHIKENKGKLLLRVGIQGEEAGAAKEGPGGAAGGLTVGEVAAFHEFGLGDNPERSFIRGWFDEEIDENRRALREASLLIVAGKIDEETALRAVGLKFVGAVQQRISSHIPPPLAPATVRRKGSDVPLIDTGQLRSSVTSKVVPR